jgi:hypothetical protein
MRKTALLQLFSVLIHPPRPLAAGSRDLPVPSMHSTICDPHRARQCALYSIRRLARFRTRWDKSSSLSLTSSPPYKLDRESRPDEGSSQRQPPSRDAFTWDELREIVATKAFCRLRRSEWQQRRYDAYQRRVQKSWKSVYDHVYVFVLATRYDGSDSSRVAHQ